MMTLRARTVLSGTDLTVTAIESLEIHTDRAHRIRYVTAELQPVAIIVKEPGRTYALDMAAQPIDIDRFDLQRYEAL